jgi:hypothetical protein
MRQLAARGRGEGRVWALAVVRVRAVRARAKRRVGLTDIEDLLEVRQEIVSCGGEQGIGDVGVVG